MKTLLVAATLALTPLPPLQPELLRAAIADLDHPAATSAQLRVTGSAAWYGAEGVANRQTGRPSRPDDRFRIGSVTKVFVATVVLQLAAERKIDLDTPVQHYLPDLLPPKLDPVTVRQLLNHTSGIPFEVGFPDVSTPEKVLEHRYDRWTPRQRVRLIPDEKAKFPPGTQQEYRGINYVLAAMLIEKITGRPYGHAVEERILCPLNLGNTYVPHRNETTIRGSHVHGYLKTQSGLVDVSDFDTSRSYGEGDMISTTGDLTRFAAALFGGELLPPEQLEEMFTVPRVSTTDGKPASYGAGLQTFTINGVTVWGKTGEQYGYNAGMFSTRDQQRRLTYSFTPTVRDSTQQQMTLRIANATTT